MEQYNVTGMSCAACSARVEKAVGKVPGVTSCSVSLLTNSMGVEGSASAAEVMGRPGQPGPPFSLRKVRRYAAAVRRASGPAGSQSVRGVQPGRSSSRARKSL